MQEQSQQNIVRREIVPNSERDLAIFAGGIALAIDSIAAVAHGVPEMAAGFAAGLVFIAIGGAALARDNPWVRHLTHHRAH